MLTKPGPLVRLIRQRKTGAPNSHLSQTAQRLCQENKTLYHFAKVLKQSNPTASIGCYFKRITSFVFFLGIVSRWAEVLSMGRHPMVNTDLMVNL
jgi:hypothetical protein